MCAEVVGHGGRSDWLLGGQLSADCRAALLARSCRISRVRRGQVLLRADDDRAVLILEGAAKARVATREGTELITAILGPGDTSGLPVALGHATAGAELVALKPIEGLVILGPELRALLPDNPAITLACLRTVSLQQSDAFEERLRFAGTSISERVALRLLTLCDRWGEPGVGQRIRITLPLSQEELAAWSGASRESVAKVLHLMRETHLIATERRSLTVLDVDRLRHRCGASDADGVRKLAGSVA